MLHDKIDTYTQSTYGNYCLELSPIRNSQWVLCIHKSLTQMTEKKQQSKEDEEMEFT